MASAQEPPFEPTLRLDVFDSYSEQQLGEPVRIAALLSDGQRGGLAFFADEFQDELKEMLHEPMLVTSGFSTDEGLSATFMNELAPYTIEALLYAMEYELPALNLRGELFQIHLGADAPETASKDSDTAKSASDTAVKQATKKRKRHKVKRQQ